MLCPESNFTRFFHLAPQVERLPIPTPGDSKRAQFHISSTSLFHPSFMYLQQWDKAVPQLLYETWSAATLYRQAYTGLLCCGFKLKSHNPHLKVYLLAVGSLHRRQGLRIQLGRRHNPQLKMVLQGIQCSNLDRTSYPKQPIKRFTLHKLLDQVRHSRRLSSASYK